MRLSILVLSAITKLSLAGQVNLDPRASCDHLRSSLSIPHVSTNLAEFVKAGTNISLSQTNNSTSPCSQSSQIVPVDLCRITANVATSNRSEVYLEVWLPTNWTGRFLSTGNGGLGGCIQYEDLAYTTTYGFVSVGTNNGHNGSSGRAFLNNDEVLTDFSYRALHTGVVIGKEVAKMYYGQSHTKSGSG